MSTARQVADHLLAVYTDDELATLRTDTFRAIEAVAPGVSVEIVDQFGTSSCGVEGMYHEASGRITVQRAASHRRTKFTALHELGHLRARRDPVAFDALTSLTNDASRRFEERIADAFAAGILIPDTVVDRILDGGAPTARHALELFEDPEVDGSREACCVKLAQRATGDGYVLLAQGQTVMFCATVGDGYRIARGVDQGNDHLLARAARHGTATADHVRLRHRSNEATREYAGQAVAAADGYVFAVLTDATSLPWGGWRPPATEHRDAPEIGCPRCDDITEAWERCDKRHRICGMCGWCECAGPVAPIATRTCEACWTVKAITIFEGDSVTCRDCA